MSGENGGAPSFHRQSTKVYDTETFPMLTITFQQRSFSVMAASHRSGSPSSLFVRDEHYDNEHSAARRRLHLSPSIPPRFAGDGFDFRRPAQTEGAAAMAGGADRTRGDGAVPVIDLTEDDFEQGLGDDELLAMDGMSGTHEDSTAAARRRVQRFVDTVVDIDDDEEQDHGYGASAADQLPGSNFLALPGPHQRHRQPHPRYSVLRRPARNGQINHEPNNASTHAHPAPIHVRSGRIGTYTGAVLRRPAGTQPIDLTEDDDVEGDDDDVAITETRQREGSGVNAAAPARPDGTGARHIPEHRPVNHFAIAELLRNRTGRLWTRLQELQPFNTLQLPEPDTLLRPHLHFAPPPAPAPAPMPPAPRLPPRTQRRHQAPNPVNQPGPWPPRLQDMQTYIGNIMDYTMPAFNIGVARPESPPTPVYSPPPDAATGFTRSPSEDETLVCPNCGDELAQGESEAKQEVWVIKTCGHAYCGVCARNRTLAPNRRARGKGKNRLAVNDDMDLDSGLPQIPPLKKCVVQDCGKPVTQTSLIHVYLGS